MPRARPRIAASSERLRAKADAALLATFQSPAVSSIRNRHRDSARVDFILYIAALLIVAVAAAHSWLGERYILMRLFRRAEIPPLFGSADFTRRTLRFTWHVTSIAWLGFAAILIALTDGTPTIRVLGWIIAATFLAHSLIALTASRGRHLSWPVFLAIGVLALYGTRF